MIVKRDGYKWKQTFSKGNVTSKLEKVEKLKKSDGTGTTVSFIPDISIFSDITVDLERYKKFVQLSAYMNKGLVFEFIGVDKKGKKTSSKIVSKNGFSDFINTLDNKLLLNKPIVISDSTEYEEVQKQKINKKIKEVKTGSMVSMECEVVMQYSKNDTGIIRTYCNGLETIEGGSHETGCRMALTEVFKKAIANSNVLTKKDGKLEILPEDIIEGLIVLVNVKHSNAIFKSQTKDKLDVEEVKWFVKRTVTENLNKWLNSNSIQAKIIYQRIVAAAKGRLAANRAKNAKKKQAGGLINGLSALSKVTLATGDDAKNKRIFIIEGDSAGSSSVNARNTKTDSIMRLRGKMLNTHDLSTTKIENNKECSDMVTAFGCGIDNTFDINKLTHNQIISMTDADADGKHISMLIATFLFIHMRPIITEGHFYIASAPLYKIEENGKNTYIYTNNDYNAYLADRIYKKFTIGKLVKKDGKIAKKKFTKKELTDFLNNTKSYKIKLENISNFNALDENFVEFIINNMDLDTKKLGLKIKKNFDELDVTLRKGTLHIEGMIGNSFQLIDLDENFFNSLSELKSIIDDNKYKNLFIQKDDETKHRKVFIGDLLDETLSYATPKHLQRFKGLGEMDYDELWETTMNPDSGAIVQVKADNIEDLIKAFDVQMGNDPDKRKRFLENFEIVPDDIDN